MFTCLAESSPFPAMTAMFRRLPMSGRACKSSGVATDPLRGGPPDDARRLVERLSHQLGPLWRHPRVTDNDGGLPTQCDAGYRIVGDVKILLHFPDQWALGEDIIGNSRSPITHKRCLSIRGLQKNEARRARRVPASVRVVSSGNPFVGPVARAACLRCCWSSATCASPQVIVALSSLLPGVLPCRPIGGRAPAR